MRILITGGTGTVGTAFMREHRHEHEFAVFSRNETLQHRVRGEFPSVRCFLGGVEDEEALLRAYQIFRPEIVIHAAAVKHIDIAEGQPIQTCKVNVLGALNVVACSTLMRTPTTIGISTDKACNASVYGYSKYLMERCFLEANSEDVRFAVCRFGNVAKSNGSVIPKWQAAAARGEPLQVTDPTMNRLMISQPDAARLIQKTIELTHLQGGFVLLKRLKQVNILALAKAISDNVVIVGARPGEKQHESLLTRDELLRSRLLDNTYVRIGRVVNPDPSTRCPTDMSSEHAEQMTEAEIKELLAA